MVDGEFWLDAPTSTFDGSPVGCDANATTLIQAADVICANLLIFDPGAACGMRAPVLASSAPLLEVSTRFDGSMVWLRGRLVQNGSGVGSLAFSLDLDPARFDFSQIDPNQDGEPDHLSFPLGQPGMAFVTFNAADPDGELDILLADLSQQPLAEGTLIEIGIPANMAQSQGIAYSSDPAPSFGTVSGDELPGIAVVGTLLFSDGFELGNTTGWALTVP